MKKVKFKLKIIKTQHEFELNYDIYGWSLMSQDSDSRSICLIDGYYDYRGKLIGYMQSSSIKFIFNDLLEVVKSVMAKDKIHTIKVLKYQKELMNEELNREKYS